MKRWDTSTSVNKVTVHHAEFGSRLLECFEPRPQDKSHDNNCPVLASLSLACAGSACGSRRSSTAACLPGFDSHSRTRPAWLRGVEAAPDPRQKTSEGSGEGGLHQINNTWPPNLRHDQHSETCTGKHFSGSSMHARRQLDKRTLGKKV